MSRLPRSLELLKTGFLTEAASAARFRAFAERAQRDDLPNLARAWRNLAEAKDQLAILQLEAAGQVRGERADVKYALGEERYQNDVLYPSMLEHLAGEPAEAVAKVLESQREHIDLLESLREELVGSRGDIAGEPVG